jgi:peptidoglycan/xylan/chitin deacetylase (PgdA/CDA1 family)
MNNSQDYEILRMDDVGASTKHWEVYGNGKITIGKYSIPLPLITNFLFLKHLPYFRAWGRYEELTPGEWEELLAILKKYNKRLIVGITANWIEKDGTAVPFPVKFPKQASLLKQAQNDGIIEIANHGFSHCIIGKHLPRLFGSNRKYHREFWPYLEQDVHTTHIIESQKVLEGYFKKDIVLFIPPGNVWSIKTYRALKKTNIRRVISRQYMADSTDPMDGIEFSSDTAGYFNFHDREIKLYGARWLESRIKI